MFKICNMGKKCFRTSLSPPLPPPLIYCNSPSLSNIYNYSVPKYLPNPPKQPPPRTVPQGFFRGSTGRGSRWRGSSIRVPLKLAPLPRISRKGTQKSGWDIKRDIVTIVQFYNLGFRILLRGVFSSRKFNATAGRTFQVISQ
jgi:hypothetical protein